MNRVSSRIDRRTGVGAFPATVTRRAIFLWHLPPRRVARRFWLAIKRRLIQWPKRPSRPPRGSADWLNEQFEPLFPPLCGGMEVGPHDFSFTFLNQTVVMGPVIDWKTDPGPPSSQLWRMKLHSMEYLAGVAVPVFVDLVRQWIATNRPYGKGYWLDAWSGHAVSGRTIVWMEEFARRRERLDADFVALLRASLRDQLTFLAANLETDIGGNHLIRNIRALATGACVLGGTDGRIWDRLANSILDRELREQILADGMHFERSPSYHCQVFADLLAIFALPGGETSNHPQLRNLLSAMAQATADLVHPDGQVALFNDAGLHMAPTPELLLSAYERLTGSRPAQRKHFSFQAAGFFGYRSSDTYCVVDCGSVGPDGLMAHAQGDILSFELSVAGERMFIDQGVFEYAAGPPRAASRAAASHNTLAIDGLDQADFFDAFRCGVRPAVEVLDHRELSKGFMIEGRHDGFTRIGGGPRHRRRLLLDGRLLTLSDWLEGSYHGGASTGLLLHPACTVVRDGGAVVIGRGSTRIRVEATVPLQLEPAVYWPDMGVELVTQRLRALWPPGTRSATTTLAITVEQTGQ